jgi:WD40 repeat protein
MTLLGTDEKRVMSGNEEKGPEFLAGLYSDDESIRSAYNAIAALMEKLDKNLVHLHMVKRTSKSGITKWIRNDPKVIEQFDKFNGERPPPPKPTRDSVATDKAVTVAGKSTLVTPAVTAAVVVADSHESGNIFQFCNAFPNVTTTRDHSSAVLCCDISILKDRTMIVTGGADKLIKLWHLDIIGVTCAKTLFGHSKEVRCVKFYLNGDRIISASGDKKIKLWDSKTGQSIGSLDGHTSIVYCLSVSVDGSTVMSSSADRTVKSWSLLSQKNTFTTNESAGWVEAVVFHPKLKYTAMYCTSEAQLRKVDCELGHVSAWQAGNNWHKQGITALCFNSSGTHLYTGSRDNTMKMWSFNDSTLLYTISIHTRTINSLSFAENFNGKNVIISGSRDGAVKITEVDATGGAHNVVKTLHYSTVINAVLSVDNRMLLCASDDCTLRIVPFKLLL